MKKFSDKFTVHISIYSPCINTRAPGSKMSIPTFIDIEVPDQVKS